MNKELIKQVVEGNQRLVADGLVTLTWGNVSAIDRSSGQIAIKPSGVPYEDLTVDSIVVLDLEGNQLEGDLRPSSDTKTHLVLYQNFPEIGSVVHTHSPFATVFSQAGKDLPCYGTTHADHFFGTVPLVRGLTEEEVNSDYEHCTGTSIVEHFSASGIDPNSMPGTLLRYHAPFTWGASVKKAIDNSIALEACAKMALHMAQLNCDLTPIPDYILNKHFERKHGTKAYYGQ